MSKYRGGKEMTLSDRLKIAREKGEGFIPFTFMPGDIEKILSALATAEMAERERKGRWKDDD